MQIRFIKEGSVTYSPQGPARVTIGQVMNCDDETIANALAEQGWIAIEGIEEPGVDDSTLVLSDTGPRSRRLRKAVDGPPSEPESAA